MRFPQRPRVFASFGLWPRLALPALALLLWGALGPGCARWPRLPAVAELPASRDGRIALYERALRAYLDAGAVPILDVGVSLAEWKDASQLIEGMDRAGVALAAVTAPREDAIWEAVRKHPGRLLPLAAGAGGDAWAKEGGEFLSSLRRQLGRGAMAIGPIRGAGLSSPGEEGKRRTEALEALLRLAAEHRVPLILDIPPDDRDIGQFERLITDQPDVQAVWTEAGHIPRQEMNPGYGHALLRALSLRHANLSFTLTTLPPPEPSRVIRPQRNLLYDPGGRFALEWQALLDSRVGHFLTGSSPGAESAPSYARRMQAFRSAILEALTPPSRPRVAYQNAWRLLTGKEWKE